MYTYIPICIHRSKTSPSTFYLLQTHLAKLTSQNSHSLSRLCRISLQSTKVNTTPITTRRRTAVSTVMGDLGGTDNASESLITHQISSLSVNDGQQSTVAIVKDPRKIARKYQLDLCEKALDENTIAYLGTGCGKTHIAVLVMYEMRCRIKKPEKDICIFLAPTVALVEQQARVIQESVDFKVGTYCGNSKRLKSHHDWEKELEEYEVLVMTPQILLHNLCHCFIRMESIALLVFDECHYAQIESNHPYAEIMKVFYKPNVGKLPRIFGMTASPKHGKGASITSLETLLHAKVYSVEDRVELEQFVSSPIFNKYYYGSATNSSLCSQHSMKIEEIKQKCFSTLSMGAGDHISLKNTKKALRRLHGNLLFCLENLGLWGALQASQILLKGDNFARNELIEAEVQRSDDDFCSSYLDQVASVFSSECMKGGIEADLSRVETLKVPYFSWKLLRLIGILSSFRLQPDMKCIIFVNRIITARSLAYVLCKLKILSSWRCHYLVGVNSGLKSMSRKNTNAILEKFRSGELNLLVATKVGEEGLDIQTCCLVIRFDLPETVASFIQSRGRARMPQSEYAFLVDRWSEKELNLIQNFVKDEAQMNNEIVSQTSSAITVDFEEKTYKVESTGATITSGSSISLLHRYCSKLPHDEYFNPKPQFYFFDDAEGTVCHIILPANAPLHQIVSAPQSSIESAKKDACLKACKELHEVGALSDFLLPGQDNDDSTHDLSDSDSDDEKDTRRELHEMLVSAVLKESWTSLENTVYLNSYFIKFSPHPADRDYRKFGLFVKTPLPEEASRMKLDLLLARGRSVVAELIPSRTVKFVKDEIMLAEKFQELCLKVILDRSDMIADTVLLGANDFSYSRSSTFYLMLPVIQHDGEDKIDVDWKLVRKCVSSPVFRTPGEARVDEACHLNNCLHLANGPKSTNEIVNSLVYAPCKHTFFFVSDIVAENNGYCTYKESTNQNHVDHYAETFGIHLKYPSQPLLKAKQLFCLDNLLRKKGHTESRDKEEHFIELPPEICQLKIIGFSKDIGSSLSLLPSIMHRLESLLVAVELKQRLSASFPEGAEVSAYRVLEALTTEKCNERFSLERLEVLGDAFLKFAVGRRLFLSHGALDEGQLTGRRSNIVNNSNLFKLAVSSNLHVYVRDQSFDPCQFFALGRQCKVICTDETKLSIHSSKEKNHETYSNSEIKCSKGHHWLHKKTVADVVEALVGAFIVDSGFKAATAFLKWFGIHVDFKASQITNICSVSTIFLPLSTQIDIPALENLLGYQFRHKGLLLQAFIHPSYNSHCGGCYQRLEFLGDAVLDYLITSYLYSVYPKLTPGQLTDLRSVSVNNNSFADIAVKKSFNKFLLCGETRLLESIDKYANFSGLSKSEKGLIEAAPCPKALGDVVESCVGAILLDSGFNLDLVWKRMLSFLEPVMKFSGMQLNPIRELQELCQFYDWNLKFPSVKKDRKFLVEGRVKGKGVSSTAFAANVNKKAAKRMAAKQICSELKAQGYKTKAKSLEEVLKSSQKMEAKLIGYDENPLDTKPSLVNQFENLKLQEPSIGNGFKSVGAENVVATKSTEPSIRPVRQSTSQCESSGCHSKETVENNSCNGYSKTKGGPRRITAKSHLYELCAANCWKPPLLECCQETGPSHLKEFMYKAVVEIEDASNTILEAIGDPKLKKKDAAENAAEGAVWYLKQLGYVEE